MLLHYKVFNVLYTVISILFFISPYNVFVFQSTITNWHFVFCFFVFLYLLFITLCGAKGCGNPDPFYIKPKVHAKEEEMSENEQRESKLLGGIAEDNPILGELRPQKGKAAHPQG